MDLIIAENSVPLSAADMPPANGTPQYATGGTPGGALPTVFPAYHYNTLIMELMAVIQAAGVVPSRFVYTQLLQSIKRIAGVNVTIINASATLTPDQAGLILVNAAAGNVVLTLPAAGAANTSVLQYNVIRTDTSANTVSIITQGADSMSPPSVAGIIVTTEMPATLVGNGISVWARLGSRGLINKQIFSANGVYTPTPGTNYIICYAVGGGGGAAGCAANGSSNNSVASGAQAGCFVKARFLSGFSEGLAVGIGSGGAGGAVNAAGGNGGATTLGSLISAPGGFAGQRGQTLSAVTNGTLITCVQSSNTPPTVSGNDPTFDTVLAIGAPGGAGFASSNYIQGGTGGFSPYGNTPSGSTNASSGVANPAIAGAAPGCGATGGSGNEGSSAIAGANGANGQLIIEEYY